MNKLLGSVLISQFCFGFADVCCPEKKVGDKTYQFIEDGDTTEFDCKDGCIYKVKDGDETGRFCFRAGGSLSAVCQNNYDNAAFIYHKPSPIFNISSERSQNQSQSQDQTVDTWKDGFATSTSQCAEATAGASIRIHYEITRRSISTKKIQDQASSLKSLIKTEYQDEFQRSTSRQSENSIWSWLGIGGDGETTNEVKKFYGAGQEGLDQARKQYIQLLGNDLNEQSKITADAWVTGLGPIPSKACIYFAVQQVKLSNGETLNIVIGDDRAWKTADPTDGTPLPNNSIEGNVIDLD